VPDLIDVFGCVWACVGNAPTTVGVCAFPAGIGFGAARLAHRLDYTDGLSSLICYVPRHIRRGAE
jgi:hypothetical protein